MQVCCRQVTCISMFCYHRFAESTPEHCNVMVVTCANWLAGTDCDIYIIFKGPNGKTARIELDTPNHDDFEEGAAKNYPIKVDSSVFPLNGLSIQHVVVSSCHWNPEWNLEKVGVSCQIGAKYVLARVYGRKYVMLEIHRR